MGSHHGLSAAGCLIACILAAACSGASSGTSGHADDDEKAPPGQKAILPEEAPGGEMIIGLSVPGVIGAGEGERSAAKEPSKMDRNDVLAAASDALEGERYDEAASFGDVLLIMFPADPEALEIRGRALIGQGDEGGGREDLERCCELGRKSCCETDR